jgi:hypothetical protein
MNFPKRIIKATSKSKTDKINNKTINLIRVWMIFNPLMSKLKDKSLINLSSKDNKNLKL